MENRLIIQLHRNNSEWKEVERELEVIFGNKPIMFELPINSIIKDKINKFRGEMRTYKMFFGDKSFPSAVFGLMIKLEDLGIDWKFRKPVQIFPSKYLFIASLYPEFGQIMMKGICGIVIQLYEGLGEN